MREQIATVIKIGIALVFGFLLTFIILLILYRLGIYSFAPKPVVSTSNVTAFNNLSIFTFIDRPILGVATDQAIFQDRNYDHITRVYDAITVENQLKWINTEDPQGVYHWMHGDYVVNNALAAGRVVHGHVLVWGLQLPQYVWDIHTCPEMKAAIAAHIQAVMNHFKDRVTTWDVVNEAYDANGNLRPLPGNPFAVCPDYVEFSFDTARQVISGWENKPLLVYNDMFYVSPPPDGQAAAAVALVQNGYADAIGIQMHRDIYNFDLTWLRGFLTQLRNLGIRANISELDISAYSEAGYPAQEADYHDLLLLAREFHDVLYRVTLWGTDDGRSWHSAELPLPWDKDLAPKPAANWFYDYVALPTNTPSPIPTNSPSPSPTLTQTSEPTSTPVPTDTPLPTDTQAPTFTPLPTYTQTPTSSPSPTHTPLATNTPLLTSTPVPSYTPRPTITPLPTSTPVPIVTAPVFRGEYFDNKTLMGRPVMIRDDHGINFNWGQGSPDSFIPPNNFSVRWTRQEYFTGGVYVFTVWSDDGLRIYVDGQLVYDRWRNQPPRFYYFNLSIPAGLHSLKVEYFEARGKASVGVVWGNY